MSDEKRSTDSKKTSELEQKNRREIIGHQTSSEHGEYSGIKIKKSHSSSPRKRRQKNDEESHTQENKRNYDLEAYVQTLALEHKESSSETEKLQKDWRQNTKSPKSTLSNLSPEKGSVQQKEEEQKLATCPTNDITEIKSSSSSDISSTSKQPPSPIENLFKSVLQWQNLFDQDVDGDTILHLAIIHQNINLTLAIILAMVKRDRHKVKGIDIQNKLRQSPLHLAVLTCQPIIVNYLLDNGAEVNAIDRNGQTALHLACKNADVENIQALRKFKSEDNKKSIKVDLKNYEGLAPIHLATLTGSCEVIGELLNMNADIDQKDNKSGRTALHHAVEAHNPIVTRYLLLKNANVNAQTFAGNTPLHTANGRGMEDIVHILLEFGADRKLTNFEGDLPIPETYMPYSLTRKNIQESKEKK